MGWVCKTLNKKRIKLKLRDKKLFWIMSNYIEIYSRPVAPFVLEHAYIIKSHKRTVNSEITKLTWFIPWLYSLLGEYVENENKVIVVNITNPTPLMYRVTSYKWPCVSGTFYNVTIVILAYLFIRYHNNTAMFIWSGCICNLY